MTAPKLDRRRQLDLERRHSALRQRFAEVIATLLFSPVGMALDSELRAYLVDVAVQENLGSIA